MSIKISDQPENLRSESEYPTGDTSNDLHSPGSTNERTIR